MHGDVFPLKMCFVEIQIKPCRDSECSFVFIFLLFCFVSCMACLTSSFAWAELLLLLKWKHWASMVEQIVKQIAPPSCSAAPLLLRCDADRVTMLFLQSSECWEPTCCQLNSGWNDCFVSVYYSMLFPITNQNGVLTAQHPTNGPKDFVKLIPW